MTNFEIREDQNGNKLYFINGCRVNCDVWEMEFKNLHCNQVEPSSILKNEKLHHDNV